MAEDSLVKKILRNGIDYESFQQMFVRQIENPDKTNTDDMKFYDYRKLNLQRSQRIEKTYSPSSELIMLINKINTKQIWMVLTESWCGDSAQCLPFIARAASLNSNIILKILLRDSNLEIMDRYLTNGSRSIPKLVAFDENGDEIFQWGPRPKAAQALINNLKKEGIIPPELYDKLNLWYGRDRGKEIEKELIELLKNFDQK